MRTLGVCGLLAGLLIALSAGLSGAEPAGPAVAPAKIAVEFELKGAIVEHSGGGNELLALFATDQAPVSVRELATRLEKAAESKEVGAVFLNVDGPMISWDHVLALRAALLKVKKAGKPVIAFASELDTLPYLLAGTADKLYLAPGGSVMLRGLLARQWFLKGTLDKLGLQADFCHVGAFKGADEPLTLTRPSKESEEMTNWLLDDYYEQLCEEVGAARGKDKAAGKAWLEGGPYTASEALKAGLIDGLKNRWEVESEVKTLAGLKENATLESRFGEKKKETLDFSNPFALLKLFTSLGNKPAEPPAQPAVGILYAEGTINSGARDGGISSQVLPAWIEKARLDASIKAVVLRINSPGGSAIASETIKNALLRLKADKPLIVSMGSCAASGGYYISAPADSIFAQPSSLVGSIGVVGGKLVVKGLLDWAGITSQKYVRGGDKTGLFDTLEPFTPAEKAWFAGSMNETYELFAKTVKDGRGQRLKDFEKVTGGRVFTGRQSLANGLVDELGGLEEALAYAAAKAGLPAKTFQMRVINKETNFLEKFFQNLSGDDDARAIPVLSGLMKNSQAAMTLKETLAALVRTNPSQAAALLHQLQLLEMLQQKQLVLMAPFEITVEP